MKISDLQPDLRNANKGTERGRAMLEESLRRYGAGRSILIDKEGRVIAGNKTLETAAALGLDEIQVVQTDGKRIVAVQRMDLDLAKDKAARELAYADNRTAEVDLDWDVDEILMDLQDGIDLDGLFYEWELDQKLNQGEDEEDFGGLESVNPKSIDCYRSIIVHFRCAEDVEAFSVALEQAVTNKTRFIWHPKEEKMNLKPYKAEG